MAVAQRAGVAGGRVGHRWAERGKPPACLVFFFRALEGNFYVQREGSADGSICERLGSEKHKLKHVLVIGNNDNSKQPRGIAAFHFVLQLLSCCSAII